MSADNNTCQTIRRMNPQRPCEKCGKRDRVELIRWRGKWKDADWEYRVGCKRCNLFTDFAKNETRAIENWKNRKYSELTLVSMRPVGSEEGIMRMLEAAMKVLRDDFLNEYAKPSHGNCGLIRREFKKSWMAGLTGVDSDRMFDTLEKHAEKQGRLLD